MLLLIQYIRSYPMGTISVGESQASAPAGFWGKNQSWEKKETY
jgi:hypothetical protein